MPVSTTAVGVSNYAGVAGGSPHSLAYGDVNGDGLSDLFVQGSDNADWLPLVNTGTGFQFAPALSIQNYRNQTRFVDINGDGRADVLAVVNLGSYKAYYVRYALASGGFSPSLTPILGSNARICEGSSCDERTRMPIFADFDSLSFSSKRRTAFFAPTDGGRLSVTRLLPDAFITSAVAGSPVMNGVSLSIVTHGNDESR